MQPVFAHRRMRGGNVCESLFEDGLCLPSGSNLSTADLEQVVSTFKESLS